MAIACDRCKKIIEDYDAENHCVSIFDKYAEQNGLLHNAGIIINNKCKPVALCNECQDELDFIMAKFMSREKITIDICDLL